jgi:hypothetical protein
MLIFGVLTGLMNPGASILLFAALAISTALFIGAAVVLMRHRGGNAISPVQTPAAPPKPDLHSKPLAEAQIPAVSQADAKGAAMPPEEASAGLKVKPEVKAAAPPEVERVTPDAVTATRVVEVKAPATAVMNMTLNEIVLAALRKDPELAAHIVAQAVLQEVKPIEREVKATQPARS